MRPQRPLPTMFAPRMAWLPGLVCAAMSPPLCRAPSLLTTHLIITDLYHGLAFNDQGEITSTSQAAQGSCSMHTFWGRQLPRPVRWGRSQRTGCTVSSASVQLSFQAWVWFLIVMLRQMKCWCKCNSETVLCVDVCVCMCVCVS